MKLIEDTRNQIGKHKIKNAYWKSQGIEVVRYPLPTGDYIIVDEKVQDVLDRKEKRGIPPKSMDFLGTYTVTCDVKNSIQELAMDICGKQHGRFRDQCILNQNNGIQLYILVENESFTIPRTSVESPYIGKLEDLHKWINPRLWIRKNGKQAYPRATRGVTLMKACMSMEREYGVKFVFCRPKDAGKKIVELLTGGE